MRRLGFPKIMAMILSMTVRYLLVFFDELENIKSAQKSRCFNIWNRKVKYLWTLKQIGYTIMMIFLNSFEKGEKIYFSMISRVYLGKTRSYIREPPMRMIDYCIVLLTLVIVVILAVTNQYVIL
jgi:cobalt/nickel transport system permease protein